MNRFLKTSLLFLLIFLLFDRSFYPFLAVSPKLEVDKRLEDVINGKLNKDLYILGSSRGARNIIASQIEDSLGISSYNLSYPGSDITFHEFLLRSILEFNEKPSLVILVMDDPAAFYPSESIKFRLDRLYPLSKYDYINEELISKGAKSVLARYLFLERINKRNFDIRRKQFTALDTILEDGSMPISFQNKNADFDHKSIAYDSIIEVHEKLSSFYAIQNLCSEKGIKLVLIFPPQFMPSDQGLEERIRQLTNNSVEIYVFDVSNPVYHNMNYYYDQTHLKKNGAQEFTAELIEYLK